MPVLALLLGAWVALPPSAPAGVPHPPREDADAAAAVTTTVGAGLDLTIVSLQAHVKKIEASQPTPDDSTTAALREYGAAIDQLELAAEWRQRADALLRLQREGPRLLASTRTEVDAWSHPAPTGLAADASQSDVEALLAETEAKLALVRKNLLDLDAEQAQLAERRLSLPAELATAGAAREGMLGELDLPPLPTGSIEATLAQRASALAVQKAAAEQAAALELELSTYETRRELLTVRRDLQRRKADAYSARVTELQGILADKRVREAEETAAEARADQASLARVHPILGGLAEENARLTSERTGADGLSAKIDATTRQLSSVSAELQRLEEHSKGVRQKVAAAGLTDAIGLLLRKEKGELPDADITRADIRVRRDEIAAVQLQALNLEDLLRGLPGVESEVEGILASQSDALEESERARIEASARNVLKTRRSYLDALTRDYNSYFAALVDLDAKQAELLRVLDDYAAFLDQHVLWIPNAALPSFVEARDWRHAALWLVDPRNAARVGARFLAASRSEPIATALGFLLMAAAAVYRRRLKALHARACEAPRERKVGPIPAAVLALAAGVLLAVPGPFAAWFAGWLLRVAPLAADEFSRALAVVLGGVAFPLFIAEFLKRAAGKQGPAASFLGWPPTVLALARGQVVFVETFTLPAFAVAALLDAQPQADWSETLGRAAFCLGVGAAGLAMHRLLSPRGVLVQQVLRRADLQWLQPVLARVAWMATSLTVLVIFLALIGYYYTAFVLVERLWWSGLVVLVFVVANAGVLRWLATKQTATAREASGESADEDEEAESAAAILRVSAQTRSLQRVVFGIALVAALFSVWVDVFPALRFFETIELWQVSATIEKTVGVGDAAHLEPAIVQVPVTVANLLLALVGAALALIGARNIPGLLELVLLSRLRLDRGLRYAIATVSRYAVFVVGAVVVFQNLGVGWSSVQWLVAAVSVGLGFGLQEIFGNFVSGLILLFERPVRVGDTVTIDGVTGTVSRIEMRATTIVDIDRKELIVPNKDLITGKLVNWSLNDPTVRLVLPVGVAYGSDTAAVVRILQDVAKQCATVLENPPPMIVMTAFGDSALEFELRVFLMNADYLGPTRHELMMEIERKFRAAGIEIPYPQRDLHLKSVEAALLAARGGAAT